MTSIIDHVVRADKNIIKVNYHIDIEKVGKNIFL